MFVLQTQAFLISPRYCTSSFPSIYEHGEMDKLFVCIIVAALSCLSLVLCRPGPQPVQLAPGCRETAMIQCVGPIIAFIMSSEGQRIGKVRKSSAITQEDFSKVCRVTQTASRCLDTWVDRCLPAEQGDLQILSKGTVKLLSFCNDTESFSKFSKMTACAEKMNNTHKACGEKLKADMPKTNFDHTTPGKIMNRENLQRDVCCNIKKYNNCITPELGTVCGAEEKTLTDKFLNRIYDAYQCTEATFSSCPASV